MKERCPRCDYKFEREEGFFLGAYTVNLAISEGLLLLLAIFPLIFLLGTNRYVSVWPIVAMGLVAAIVAPLVFYPFSRTIWSAIDLVLRPQDRPEPADRHHLPPARSKAAR
jgi:Na+/phosphate symporter